MDKIFNEFRGMKDVFDSKGRIRGRKWVNHRDLKPESYYHYQQLCDYYDDASMENT